MATKGTWRLTVKKIALERQWRGRAGDPATPVRPRPASGPGVASFLGKEPPMT